MAYLRTTASLLDFAFECSRIKKRLSNLKNMTLTPQETIEYLERMISNLIADKQHVYRLVKEHSSTTPYVLMKHINSINYATSCTADNLIEDMQELVNNLQKLDAK